MRHLSGRLRVRDVGGSRVEAVAHGLGAVVEHLPLVVADRAEEVLAALGGLDQAAAQQVGVAQGGVRAVAAGRRGGVDGVTEQRDRAGCPALAGLDYPDGQ